MQTPTPIKPLQERDIALESQQGHRWFLDLDIAKTMSGGRVEFADIFRVSFWHNWRTRLNIGDRIRILGRAERVDFEVSVLGVTESGVLVRPWPCLPPDLDRARAEAGLAGDVEQRLLRERAFGAKGAAA